MLRLRKKQPHVDSIEAYACSCICQMVNCPCNCGMCDEYTLFDTRDRQWDPIYHTALLNSTTVTRSFG
jgi:putative bacteriocin precursor